MRNGKWDLRYEEESGSFFLHSEKLAFRTRPAAGRTNGIEETDAFLRFDFEEEDLRFSVTVRPYGESAFSLTLEGEEKLSSVAFPGAFLPEKGDRYLYPYGDGIIWNAEKEPPFPSFSAFYCGSELSMGFIGLLRGQGGVLTGILETADAGLRCDMRDGLTENQVIFFGSKGRWDYARTILWFPAEEDAFNTLCDAYRSWRDWEGGVVTLQQKAERVPSVRSLAGAADIWLFDDNTMNRLYGRPEKKDAVPRDVRRAAAEMLSFGMTSVLFHSFEGEAPEDIEFLKDNGMNVGRYDIYRDIIPKPVLPYMLPYRVNRSRHTAACWPHDVRITEKGEYATAWKLHGTDGRMYDQHAVCDIPALRMIREDLPGFLKEGGYTAWFVDVSMGSAHSECFHQEHPSDRRTSLQYKNRMHEYIMDLGLIPGVEVGCEAGLCSYVYSEGMMSPPRFRAPDAGRNMNTLYYGDGIPEQILQYDLNPLVRIPIWQRVYHDCTVNYWYWGDSSNCCPELMPLRDQFNALYAIPPLYSLSMSQWDRMKTQIALSYHRATAAARLAAFSPMTRFEYADKDGFVQRTVFQSGLRVTANFGKEPFDGIKPGGCLAEDPRGPVFSF